MCHNIIINFLCHMDFVNIHLGGLTARLFASFLNPAFLLLI